MTDPLLSELLLEIRKLTGAVERLAGPAPLPNDWSKSDCFVWSAARHWLQPVPEPNRVELGLIRSVDHVRDILHDNTARFARGFAANNVFALGARGEWANHLWSRPCMPASTWKTGSNIKLVEVHREDIDTLPRAHGNPAPGTCQDDPVLR